MVDGLKIFGRYMVYSPTQSPPPSPDAADDSTTVHVESWVDSDQSDDSSDSPEIVVVGPGVDLNANVRWYVSLSEDGWESLEQIRPVYLYPYPYAAWMLPASSSVLLLVDPDFTLVLDDLMIAWEFQSEVMYLPPPPPPPTPTPPSSP